MARRRNKSTVRKASRFKMAKWLPSARTRQRWRKLAGRTPRAVRLAITFAVVAGLAVGVNWA